MTSTTTTTSTSLRPMAGVLGSVHAGVRALLRVSLCLALATTNLSAQGESALDRMIDRVPASTNEARESLLRDLAKLGADDFRELCRRISSGGAEDTAAARSLLHGWVLSADELPNEQRAFLVSGLQSAAGNGASDVRRLFIEQLHYLDASAVAPLLRNPELIVDSVRAILAAPKEGAGSILRSALVDLDESAPVEARVALIDGVASLGDERSIPILTRQMDANAAPAVRDALLSARARLGDAAVVDPLVRELQATSATARARAAANLSRLAKALAKAGKMSEAQAIYSSLMSAPAGQSTAVRIMALRGLVEIRGAGAMPQIIGALTGEDAEFRQAGREIALALEGSAVDIALRAQLDGARPEVARVVLDLLGARGDRASREAILSSTTHDDPTVRDAAWRALVQLDPYGAVEPMVAAIDGAGRTTQLAIILLLAELPGHATSARLVAAAADPERSPGAIVALLDAIARRGVIEDPAPIVGLASHSERAVRRAAVRAIGQVSVRIDPLIEVLQANADETLRVLIQRAGVALLDRLAKQDVARVQPEAASILRFLDDLAEDDVARRSTVVHWLGRAGGDRAFDAIVTAWRNPREELQDAAIEALREWPDASQAEAILVMAEKSEEIKGHVLALRAYLRLTLEDADATIEEQLAAFERAFRVARRETEQKLVIGKLAELSHPKTLEFLHQFEGSARVGLEAEMASLRVAESLLPARWSLVKQKASYLQGATEHASVREYAGRVEKKALEYQFVVDWKVAGPYSKDGNPNQQNLVDRFAPEIPSEADSVEWKRQPIDDSTYWRIDLNASVGGENCVAYLFARVRSATAKEAVLELGSDDGIRVFWNGEVVHHNPVPRGVQPAQDKVRVTLANGWNELVLKVSQISGNWGACLRIVDENGQPIPDLVIDAGDGHPTLHGQ